MKIGAGILLSALGAILQAGPVSAGELKGVTFNKDVAPILFQRCSGCHRPGEVAPFPLLNYRDASKRSKLIAELTSSRQMPPWKAVHGSGDFADERRLTDDEIGVIRRWSEAGAIEGDPADLPASPKFTAGWQLGEPDLVLKMPESYTLTASGPDEYRCFVLPIQIPAGKYIKAIEYRPGNRKIVHHAVLSALPHAMAAAKLAAGDGKSFLSGLAPPGRLLSGPLSIWTPGMEPHFLPGDLAASWPDKTDLVLQLHLHPSGKPEVEQSMLGIHLTGDKPRSRLQLDAFSSEAIDIAPGTSDYEVKVSRTLDVDATMFGVFPHMHLIGRSVHAVATLPDATKVPLISIADWDFNWQYYYQYRKPVKLPAGTRIDVSWTYDNSDGNPSNPSKPARRVTYGEQTADEMAFLIFDTIMTGPPKAKSGRRAEVHRRQRQMNRANRFFYQGNLMAKKTKAAETTVHEINGKAMSKAEAIRLALAEGIESPTEGVAFIKSNFGIDISLTHFSAGKSLAKKAAAPSLKPTSRPTDGRVAPSKIASTIEGDLIDAMEKMKPLVALLGAEKVKRLAELLG